MYHAKHLLFYKLTVINHGTPTLDYHHFPGCKITFSFNHQNTTFVLSNFFSLVVTNNALHSLFK